MKIPVEKIFEFSMKNFRDYLKDKDKKQEYLDVQQEQFEIMQQIKWDDFEVLPAKDLERIPIGWIYDWMRVTGYLEYQDKVKELYEKHNLKVLSAREFLFKFKKRSPVEYDDVRSILPHFELEDYIKKFLIDNDEFINDVDSCMWELSCDNKLINKSVKERIEYFENTIGNESRTYILKILTLKHLLNVLLKNINGFTPEFWRDRLKKIKLI